MPALPERSVFALVLLLASVRSTSWMVRMSPTVAARPPLTSEA